MATENPTPEYELDDVAHVTTEDTLAVISTDSDGNVVLRMFPVPSPTNPLESGDRDDEGMIQPRHVTILAPHQAVLLSDVLAHAVEHTMHITEIRDVDEDLSTPTDATTETSDLPPGELACSTIDGDDVNVMIGGNTTCETHGRHEFITVGVLDGESDDDVIARSEYRELINVYPPAAIRLARSLLDYATDMLDDDDDAEPRRG